MQFLSTNLKNAINFKILSPHWGVNITLQPTGRHVVGKGTWNFQLGKNEKLINFHLSWKAPIEVWKFSMQHKVIKKFQISARTFQLHSFQFHFELSNFLKISTQFSCFIIFVQISLFYRSLPYLATFCQILLYSAILAQIESFMNQFEWTWTVWLRKKQFNKI